MNRHSDFGRWAAVGFWSGAPEQLAKIEGYTESTQRSL
jgi:hypothetical protein